MLLLSKKLYNPRKERPKNNDNFETIKDYEEIAEKQIKHFCKRHYPYLITALLRSEERVADVMHENMVADWEWDSSRGMTRHSYRNSRAFWIIKNLAEKLAKKRKVVFYDFSSFNSVTAEDGKPNIDETIYNQRTYENKLDPRIAFHQQDIIDSALVRLKERDRVILNHYYVDGMTLEEIGESLEPKITRQRVQQILVMAKQKLEEMNLAG